MGKKRSIQASAKSIKIEVKDEINDNEVLVARDRLKGALRELLRNSDEGSSAESADELPPPEMKPTPVKKSKPPPTRKIKRRKQLPADQLFHHTYVMKLFDRSVDLAQFREDTPLYPICRAWLANQPRNPNLVPKVRTPSPEIVDEVHTDNNLEDSNGELRDVFNLPLPKPAEEAFPRNRIPSPSPQPKEKLDLNYEGKTLKSKETLMKSHRLHWNSVRRKWHQQAQKNEKRFQKSANILETIFKRAQSEFE
ncbi:protein lin-37 homolog [Microplitis mediator]|uniref:protein lin-37 homolog n=1 Tax=Microplitis mediator TaxID=375433 RepID=UPI0025548A10|nr:protein lin-37 homolog [Microplitis mediator]